MNGTLSSKSFTFTRPANTTAYAAGDVVGVSLTVTGASNASPIVITTSAAHGLTTGDYVTVASVGGNTAANTSAKVVALTATTFQLFGTTGNAAYTSGGTVAQWFRIQPNSNRPGTNGMVRTVKVQHSASNATNSTFSMLFLQAPTSGSNPVPAPLLDNVAYATTAGLADGGGFVGKTGTITVDFATTGGTSGQLNDINLPFDLQGSETSLYCVLLANAAYTPASAEKFQVDVVTEWQ